MPCIKVSAFLFHFIYLSVYSQVRHSFFVNIIYEYIQTHSIDAPCILIRVCPSKLYPAWKISLFFSSIVHSKDGTILQKEKEKKPWEAVVRGCSFQIVLFTHEKSITILPTFIFNAMVIFPCPRLKQPLWNFFPGRWGGGQYEVGGSIQESNLFGVQEYVKHIRGRFQQAKYLRPKWV